MPTSPREIAEVSQHHRATALQPQVYAHDVVDLTHCDREPIHIPGAIQPHGVLLVVRAEDFVVRQASANTRTLLGIDAATLVGQRLHTLMGAQATNVVRLVDALRARGERRSDVPLRFAIVVDGHPVLFDGVLHLVAREGVLLLELERAEAHDQLSLFDFHALVRRTLERVRGATTLDMLARAVAEQMRVITGYDRVWVYRFHADWHGEIIAESRRQGIESWLGLHYPASDIPAQARALFVEHPLRVIADVQYVPSPLVPLLDPDTGDAVDLGGAILRSASAVHREYMRNMGVRASLVVSLVHEGRLWGLISGHHYAAPKLVPFEIRTVCEFLGQAFSVQLAAAERDGDEDRAAHRRVLLARLGDRLAHDAVTPALLADPSLLLDVAGADGAAAIFGTAEGVSVACAGQTPTEDELRELVSWLDARADVASGGPDTLADTGVLATDALGSVYPPAVSYAAFASGLMAVRLEGVDPPTRPEEHGWLLWFRAERRQTIRWGGDPMDKPVEPQADGTLRLSPRRSFAVWEAEVKGTATPWRVAEQAAAILVARMVSTSWRWTATSAVAAAAGVAGRDLRSALHAFHDSVSLSPDEKVTLDGVIARLDRMMDALLTLAVPAADSGAAAPGLDG